MHGEEKVAGGTLVGVDAELDSAEGIVEVNRALGQATGWHEHIFAVIHDVPSEPHLQMALGGLLARAHAERVGVGTQCRGDRLVSIPAQ